MHKSQNKIVAVLNKTLTPGRALNTLGHIALATGGINTTDTLELIDYYDNDSNCYPSISKMPFIVLKANSNKILNLYKQAIENGAQAICFTDTMTCGTWQEQVDLTKEKSQEELQFYGAVVLGESELVTRLTRKFSLWQ